MGANARVAEVTAIGRILAEYNNLEIDLLHCVQMGIGNFDQAFKTMFATRGESRRIKAAEDLGRPAYQALGLDADFDLAIVAIRHALKIRNQYAHWTWWGRFLKGEIQHRVVSKPAPVPPPLLYH